MHLILYGVALIGLGAWFEWRKRQAGGVHVHRCAKCGTEWAHKPVGEYPSARAAVDAHTCPKCGAEQFDVERYGAAGVLAFDAKTAVPAVRTTAPAAPAKQATTSKPPEAPPAPVAPPKEPAQ
jgi:ssDNA-binding Zn-finger/Zn-ribbon topoisomerase 1